MTVSHEVVIDKNTDLGVITTVCGDIRGSYEDIVGNGTVDFDDFIRVLRGFVENSSAFLRYSVDINEDGAVNVNDLAVIKVAMSK